MKSGGIFRSTFTEFLPARYNSVVWKPLLVRFLKCLMSGIAAIALLRVSAMAEEFKYIGSYRGDLKADPTILRDLLANDYSARVFEYRLQRGVFKFTIFQVWNSSCDLSSCPTRLVESDGSRQFIMLTQLMHQIIPPDDPRFSYLPLQAQKFRNAPFDLSVDGHVLTAGPDRFDIK